MTPPAEPFNGRPVRISMVELLRLADAFPLLDRLALIVTMREGGDRQTIVFGILDELRDHLDATAPAGVEETVDAIRAWFDDRIAGEEDRTGGRA